MFYDRTEAGKKLALKLNKYQKNKKVIVLAIPRGGVPVAFEVAKKLKVPLDLIIVRKLPMPDNPEAGIGAVSETGEIFWHPQAKLYPKEAIKKILSEQKEEIKRRIKVLRKGKGLAALKDKIVILIDDGLAMGSTMRAAIKTVKKEQAEKVVVAIPVAGREILKIIKSMADEVVCLEVPSFFQAVAQVYENWHDLSDQEVTEIMGKRQCLLSKENFLS